MAWTFDWKAPARPPEAPLQSCCKHCPRAPSFLFGSERVGMDPFPAAQSGPLSGLLPWRVEPRKERRLGLLHGLSGGQIGLRSRLSLQSV